VTDLPVEEAAVTLPKLQKNDLAPIFLAAPTSTDERLKRIAAVSKGFVYAVSRTGVDRRTKGDFRDARKLAHRLQKFTKLPVAVGRIRLQSNSRRLAGTRTRRWWKRDCGDNRTESGTEAASVENL